jgi:hypothetical protein
MPNMAARLSSNLKRLFDAYCLHQGIKPTTVGLDATKDPRFYAKVETGSGGFQVQTYDKVVAWFAAVWPTQLDWPDGIPRPVVEARQPLRRKPRKSNGRGAGATSTVLGLAAIWFPLLLADIDPIIELLFASFTLV